MLKRPRPRIYGDQPKTVNQNLNVTVMSIEQREKEAQALLDHIQALGLPMAPEYINGADYVVVEEEGKARSGIMRVGN